MKSFIRRSTSRLRATKSVSGNGMSAIKNTHNINVDSYVAHLYCIPTWRAICFAAVASFYFLILFYV